MAQKNKKLEELQLMYNRAAADLLDARFHVQHLELEERKMRARNTKLTLNVYQLESQRDVLIAALAHAQRRMQNLEQKNRPCGCGAGVNPDSDISGMPLTDRATERL